MRKFTTVAQRVRATYQVLGSRLAGRPTLAPGFGSPTAAFAIWRACRGSGASLQLSAD